MNWKALGTAAFGALLGGLGGAFWAGYHDEDMGRPALLGASLGALAGAAFSPKTAAAAQKAPPIGSPGGRSITVTAGGNMGISVPVGSPLVLNIAGQPKAGRSDTPGVLVMESVDPISVTFKAVAAGSAVASVDYTDLNGDTQTATIPVTVA